MKPLERRSSEITLKIDRVLTHRIFGLPLFLGIIFAIFYITFLLGRYPAGWIESLFGALQTFSFNHLGEGVLRDMVINGLISGAGSVAVYLPNIVILFLFISFMDESGYSSRTALLADKLFNKAGLRGNSFIPLLIGFGCNVPAVMATRSLERKRDRILTMLIIPFMSCSAKLPVYILFISVFFEKNKSLVLFSIYLFGIILAWLTALFLSKTVLKEKSMSMNLELPDYRFPGIISILKQMWEKTIYFIKKIGGVILVASVIIWALGYFPMYNGSEYANENTGMAKEGENSSLLASINHVHDLVKKSEGTSEATSGDNTESAAIQLENSYICRIGKIIYPVFRPLGFDWQMSVSILTGLPAKEIIISTLGVLYNSVDDLEDENEFSAFSYLKSSEAHSGLTAISFMIFILVSFPCIGTLTAIRREAGKFVWTIFSVVYTTGLAWVLAFAFYQVGGIILKIF